MFATTAPHPSTKECPALRVAHLLGQKQGPVVDHMHPHHENFLPIAQKEFSSLPAFDK